ncbi:methyltransferase [Sphingobacterium sp. E70]|uniref:tRNA1(Val) (adenine(37)-N6)-methyltransferase n=1 Tax=Sphingobacterium sp. E70 TaxID=2853439 RepID=UPI00211BDD3A|nr:methyltransferase [Sphingobacterium sp. E70]ULT27547.1 methyltransferase [Sphingobacterium sp. E70]
MASIFRFKQFEVDQSNCAMKINTDGVLLASLVDTKGAKRVLDVGTGTGVIALMLAQRLIDSHIEAVEIDALAAEMASRNFSNSIFQSRLVLHAKSFQQLQTGEHYDLIVSNPPFIQIRCIIQMRGRNWPDTVIWIFSVNCCTSRRCI